MLLSLDIGERAEARFPGAPGNNEPHGWERQPLAAISVGDPDTADTTTFGAPGMGSGTHKMHEEVTTSEQLHLDLQKNGDGSHAVVSWVGYDPPAGLTDQGDSASVWRDDRANAGGWDFAYALDGFQETRTELGNDPNDFTINVHAHSYGTNMSAHALTRIDHEIDAVAFYGSSGIPESVAEHASDFKVAVDGDGQPMVFASESTHDTTAPWGRLVFLPRQDPTAEDFGAREYYSGHQHDGDATNLADVTGHSRTEDENDPEIYGYLDPDTAHYDNLEAILTGNHHEILTTEKYSEDWVPMDDVLRNHYRISSGP